MTSDQSDGAVVTGAASGIGRAIAAALAKDGFSVVIGDLDEANGRAAAKEIAAANKGRAIFQRVDVTDRRSVSAAIETCTRQFSSIKVMVNNAGFNKPEPFLEASEAIWQKTMDVNALGVMIGIQEAAKAMIAAGTKGKIINTASIAGRTGYADFAPYCASKFAVVALTHAGARALAGNGITVNAFAPGVVATPLWEQLDKDLMAMARAPRPGRRWIISPDRSCLAVSPSPMTSSARSGSWRRRLPWRLPRTPCPWDKTRAPSSFPTARRNRPTAVRPTALRSSRSARPEPAPHVAVGA
jgi:meso-butanediol dehydrogenase / (S,S)-butanediol dehydrogenase / diacetyl reductase